MTTTIEPATLSPQLQELARQYVAARRKSGEALLEAARALAEARAACQHGEWYTFLEATGTSQDVADRLLAMHRQALDDARYADAVRSNFLTLTTAAELASAPPAVRERLLSQDAPPTQAQIRAEKRAANPAAPRAVTSSAEMVQPGAIWQSKRLNGETFEAGAVGQRSDPRKPDPKEPPPPAAIDDDLADVRGVGDRAAYEAQEAADQRRLAEAEQLISLGQYAAARGSLDEVRVATWRRDQLLASIPADAPAPAADGHISGNGSGLRASLLAAPAPTPTPAPADAPRRLTCPTCGETILNGVWGERKECGECYHKRARQAAQPAQPLRVTMRTTGDRHETDVDDQLAARLLAAGYTWQSATITPDGRWHHLVDYHDPALQRREQQRMRRERLVALAAPAAAPEPADEIAAARMTAIEEAAWHIVEEAEQGRTAAAVRAALALARLVAGDNLADLAAELDDAEYEALARLCRVETESEVGV